MRKLQIKSAMSMFGVAVSRRAVVHTRSFASCPAAANLAEKLSNLPPPPSMLASTSNVHSSPSVATPLLSLSLTELTARLKDMGEKPYRAKQIWKHVYRRGVGSFDEMSDIAAPLRAQLAQQFSIDYGHVFSDNTSADGTRKFGLTYKNAADVEAVYIPAEDRGTLCFSSQHGCSLQCSFCHTGTMDKKKLRNLKVDEIVGQIMLAKQRLGDFQRMTAAPHACPRHVTQAVTNLVAMGMGEPGYNWRAVKQAMRIVMDADGIGIGKRRITISTSGVVPIIAEVGDELDVNLAISLHACRNDIRDVLVPINKTYPLDLLMEACRLHTSKGSRRKVTFEYVMLAGVNDSDADADELGRLCADIPCMINLIPFNPWPGTSYTSSSDQRIVEFADRLMSRHRLVACVRWPRGRDVNGACGQLATRKSNDPNAVL